MAVHDLCQDVTAQIGDGKRLAYPKDELVVRFHHRLVAIHPFVNGNGRHARLVADLLAEDLGSPPFSWGGTSLTGRTRLRADYLAALRVADRHQDFGPLLEFARRSER